MSRTSNEAIGCREQRAATRNQGLRFEIATPRNRRTRLQLLTTQRRKRFVAPGPFEGEHPRRLEAQHVALGVQKRFEIRGQFDLVHGNALARKLIRSGLDCADR